MRSVPWVALESGFLVLLALGRNASAEQVTLPLKVTDGLEFDWQIDKTGHLTPTQTLHRNCYLYIGKSVFPGFESGTRNRRQGGIEIIVGPKVVAGVTVTRKLYFGRGEGHMRYMDVIENRTTTPVTVPVKLRLRGGTKVWSGVATKVWWENPNAYVSLAGAKGGSSLPESEKDTNSLVWQAISIQPQSKVVILHFIARRKDRETALQFAQKFAVAPACRDADPDDLASVINYDPRTLGVRAGVTIFRGGKSDAIVLKSEDKLTGTVLNEKVRIQTAYALLEFPTSDIATIIFEGGANNIERIVVLNGDVFSGFIIDPYITVKLAAGPQIRIRKEKIAKLGFRIRATEKKEYPVNHAVTLTNGDHFSGTVKNKQLTIGAAFGKLPVEVANIAKIDFISKKGTVTRITLRNRDTVSGFLENEDITIDLDFGKEVAIYQDRIEKIVFDPKALEKTEGKKGAEKPRAKRQVPKRKERF